MGNAYMNALYDVHNGLLKGKLTHEEAGEWLEDNGGHLITETEEKEDKNEDLRVEVEDLQFENMSMEDDYELGYGDGYSEGYEEGLADGEDE